MTKEIELKPCPFCGGKAELHRQSDLMLDYIACPKCGLYMDTENFDSVDMLIENWNRRASLWISIKNDCPRFGQFVLIAFGNNLSEIDIATIGNGWTTACHGNIKFESVKYFMYIPELPRE